MCKTLRLLSHILSIKNHLVWLMMVEEGLLKSRQTALTTSKEQYADNSL